MKRPQVLVWGVAWAVVVVAASALTWAVIDSVGRNVLDTSESGQLPAAGVTAGTGASTDEPVRSGTPRPRPSATATPSSPTDSPTDGPTEGPIGGGADQGGPTPVTRGWQGSAGSVTVRCEGPSASLVSTSPANGWRLEVDKRGPGEVRVEFETGGDDERRTRVRSRCGGGVPRFEVDVDD